MSEIKANENAEQATAASDNIETAAAVPATQSQAPQTAAVAAAAVGNTNIPVPIQSSSSKASTPASSVTGGPTSKLRAPTNFGSTGTISKIGRLCSHATPKAGPPPRDTNSMSRESDDNLSSINSTYTDMYQETVKRFTRSSLSPEMERYASPSRSTKSTSTSQKSYDNAFDLYLEATGRRRSSDHGAVLTADTEQFIIGQKVWVGGIRPGQIAYIGETHFAPGEWAGIVLDEPNGKNDGCVAGKRYFQCEPKRGIFSRLTRLTVLPLPGTPTSPISKFSPDRSRTVSPTASIRSSFMRSPGGKNGLTVGDRVIVSSGFGSRPGILRYLGETQFASGNWCGIELDEGTGKNDGTVDGIRYFDCKPKYGVFVPIAKVSLSPSSKKTRLSRTGSRESLTSIGTMNSIATTNTSRMRMNAQRKSSSIKPIVITTPKSQFSMQDLLREKQNHIEQLMIERDLDREDSQNQALNFQKNISELQTRITKLERQLEDERKKSEDLQFSIDEATFCGDELSVQTQVYKEKIHDLERKVSELSSGASSLQVPSTQDSSAAIETANKQIAELNAKLQAHARLSEVRVTENVDEQKRLQENITYLQTENEMLRKELLDKDESLEKFSLSESGLDNLRRELALLKEEGEKERNKTDDAHAQLLKENELHLKTITAEMSTLKGTLGMVEGERANVEDECEILRSECKNLNSQLQSMMEEVAKLTAEVSMQKAANAMTEDLLKTQEAQCVPKTALDEKVAETGKLNQEIVQLKEIKTNLQSKLKMAEEQLLKLAELQKSFEEKLQAITSDDQQKQEALQVFEKAMEELKQQVSATSGENAKLSAELKSLQEASVSDKAAEQGLRKELEEKAKLLQSTSDELKVTKEMLEKLQSDFANLQQATEEKLKSKAQELESFQAEISQHKTRIVTLESESSSSVQQMSQRISELEAQLKQLQGTLKTKEATLEAQQQQHAQQEALLAEKLSELKGTTEALDSTNSLLDKLKQEHADLLGKYHELEELLKQSEAQCARAALDMGSISRKHEALTAKCENVMSQNETLQQDILVARTAGSEAQQEAKKLNEELTASRKTCSELQSNANEERLKFESQVEELNQKLTNASKDYEELKESLQKTKEDLTKKQEQITTLEEKTIKQELLVSDAQRQQENLQTKYAALATQNESLQGDLNTLRSSSTDSNAELLKLSQDNAAKQKSYEELLDRTSAERATLESQLQAGQQRVDALCSQVETLTQELKTSTEESFKRFELLKQREEKAGKQELELGDLARKLESLNTKCEGLESRNEGLQKELASIRSASTDSNAEVLKLTEELSGKQKQLQEFTDKAAAERLQLEGQLQELAQQLQASQNETDSLRNELKSTADSKTMQASEFESLKAELQTKAAKELESLQAQEQGVRQKLLADFEQQQKSAEQTKITLDEAISSLQQQIQLLQDELLKSQLDFKSKEEDFGKQLALLSNEKQKLQANLLQAQNEGSTTLGNIQQEKSELTQMIQQLTQQLNSKEEMLRSVNSQLSTLNTSHTTINIDLSKLNAEVKTLQSSLELTNTELEHKNKLALEDKQKLEELRAMLDALQNANAHMSNTNAELSEALQLLEAEKCETANIFELFEMEADQNASKLIEKLSNLKHELTETKTQLETKQSTLNESQKSLESLTSELQASQEALSQVQASVLEHTTKLSELTQANAELKLANAEKDALLQQHEEVKQQLSEYKQVVDEMDDASTEKTSKLTILQTQIQQLEQALESQQIYKTECASLQHKLESMDLEKTREIVALQARINDLQSIAKLKQNGAGAAQSSKAAQGGDAEDSTAQINFLNSIIADMQKKNETLKAKIEALEAIPTDFTKPKAFELLTKRKPAPRMFCDICDEFDRHETEDCPLQASEDFEYTPTLSTEANNNDPANKKERKLPEPRKYCETCEMFGHETGECNDDECY